MHIISYSTDSMSKYTTMSSQSVPFYDLKHTHLLGKALCIESMTFEDTDK